MTGRDEFRGSKYEAGRDVKDIAKDVRKDIAAAIKSGELPAMKVSVQIERFSGGCALRAKIVEISGGALNPAHVRASAADPYKHAFDLPPRYTATAQAALETMKKIVRAYKRDASDSMTDYFDVNFYDTVDVSYTLERAEREAILAAPAPELETADEDGDDDPDGGPSGSPAPEGEEKAEDGGELETADALGVALETASDAHRKIADALVGAHATPAAYNAAVARAVRVAGAAPADCRAVSSLLCRKAETCARWAIAERLHRMGMAARKAAEVLEARRDENLATVLRVVREAPEKLELPPRTRVVAAPPPASVGEDLDVPIAYRLRPELGDDGGFLGVSFRAERENRAAVAALAPQAAPKVEVEAETPPAPVRALDRRQAAARFDAILVAAVEALVEVDSDAAARAIFALVDRALAAAVETLAGTGGVADLSEEVWGACARTDLEAHGWASAKALRAHLEKTYG